MGVQEPALRWLVVKGYAEHAHELTTFREVNRRFRPGLNVSFASKTCFVITDAGAKLAASLHDNPAGEPVLLWPATIPFSPAIVADLLPQWKPDERKLRLGPCIVKEFDNPRTNQEAVLARSRMMAGRTGSPIRFRPLVIPFQRIGYVSQSGD